MIVETRNSINIQNWTSNKKKEWKILTVKNNVTIPIWTSNEAHSRFIKTVDQQSLCSNANIQCYIRSMPVISTRCGIILIIIHQFVTNILMRDFVVDMIPNAVASTTWSAYVIGSPHSTLRSTHIPAITIITPWWNFIWQNCFYRKKSLTFKNILNLVVIFICLKCLWPGFR